MILRRLYLYLVSAASLAVLAIGLAALGATLMLFVFNDPSADTVRTSLAIFAAMTIVALPVWGVHFWFAQRFATRDPYERASAIRHLYLYGASLAFAIATLIALADTLAQLLAPVLDGASLNGETAAEDGWITIVFAAIWLSHFYLAMRDRIAVREEGASATLRRWYMYTALFVGLLVMLAFTQQLLELAWRALVITPVASPIMLETAAGAALSGLVVWGFHSRVIATQHLADDRHSTLRAVEGFLAVAVSVATALFGASQILYYALARILGVSYPGGASDNVLIAAGPPVSLLLVYGVAWILISRRLARDSETQEAERQAGVRRLYTNLVALISLGLWASGAAALLGIALTELEAPIIGVASTNSKDSVSLYTTLFAVGAAVWLAYWRHSPWASDRQSFSRRLYVYAALLGSVLAALGGGVLLVYVVLQQAFSAHPRLDDDANLGFGRALAVIVVAAAVSAYHWRVLRSDAASRPARAAVEPQPAVIPAAASSSDDKPTAAPEMLGLHSRRYSLVVTDATDDDVHQALASLPPQASYKLTATEQTVDGH